MDQTRPFWSVGNSSPGASRCGLRLVGRSTQPTRRWTRVRSTVSAGTTLSSAFSERAEPAHHPSPSVAIVNSPRLRRRVPAAEGCAAPREGNERDQDQGQGSQCRIRSPSGALGLTTLSCRPIRVPLCRGRSRRRDRRCSAIRRRARVASSMSIFHPRLAMCDPALQNDVKAIATLCNSYSQVSKSATRCAPRRWP